MSADQFRAAFTVPAPSPELANSAPTVVAIKEHMVVGTAGPIPVRMYRPVGDNPLPIALFSMTAGP